ncbi:hypothetical protein CJP46_07680 [Paenibacillus sp. XY044]|nr:hypothetical protein CJP46_07680 [Paenibacillus sp. XY044]
MMAPDYRSIIGSMFRKTVGARTLLGSAVNMFQDLLFTFDTSQIIILEKAKEKEKQCIGFFTFLAKEGNSCGRCPLLQ